MRDAVFFCEHAGDDIHLVAVCDGDEDIRALDIGSVHRERTCDVRLDRQHVECHLCRLELALFAVHHHDIHVLLREQRRDAIAQPSRPRNYNTHNEPLLRLPTKI